MIRLRWPFERVRPARPIEDLARIGYEAVRRIDIAEGRTAPEWGALHTSNQARYVQVAAAIATACGDRVTQGVS